MYAEAPDLSRAAHREGVTRKRRSKFEAGSRIQDRTYLLSLFTGSDESLKREGTTSEGPV
jgi:hypothetical protein